MNEHPQDETAPPAVDDVPGTSSTPSDVAGPDEIRVPGPDVVDLDAVERDLADVEAALRRLADGTYWIDEVTGEPLPEDRLVADPTARRA